MLHQIGQFLLSEWLWSVTWDWHHLPINIVLMCLLFKWLLRANIIPAVFLAFSSHLFAFVTYSIFVVFVLMYLIGLEYIPSEVPKNIIGPLKASIFLGLIYTALHMCFFLLINRRYKLNISGIFLITILSNMMTSLFVYSLVYTSYRF